MEHTGTIPLGGIADPDLRDVALAAGPVATVVTALDPATDHADHRDGLRWAAQRADLAAAGAPDGVLEAIDALVPDAHRDGAALMVVAGADDVRLVAHATDAPRREVARWAPLADLGPFVARRQAELPHLAVVVDHAGADIAVDRGRGPIDLDRVRAVDARPLHDAAAGGWAQRHHQERVHAAWADNARAAADRVVELADSIGARAVVVSGDPRSAALFVEALPAEVAGIVERADGSASAGGARSEAAEVERLVHTVAARDSVALLEAWKGRLATGRATTGAGATLAALREANVEVLLVHDDPDDERFAFFGPAPEHASLDRDDVAAMGVEAVQGRLIDVAVRAALGTGASVRVVPRHGGPLEGLGALLRWS